MFSPGVHDTRPPQATCREARWPKSSSFAGMAGKPGREFSRLAKSRSLPLEHCACVGDDTPDAPMLNAAGLAIAVADAHRDALAVADLVTSRPGGLGAVREVCDWLLDARRMRGVAPSGAHS